MIFDLTDNFILNLQLKAVSRFHKFDLSKGHNLNNGKTIECSPSNVQCGFFKDRALFLFPKVDDKEIDGIKLRGLKIINL